MKSVGWAPRTAPPTGAGPTSPEPADANTDTASTVEELRRESSRFLLVVALLAFLAWHLGRALLGTTAGVTADTIVRQWLLFVVVVGPLGATYLLHQRRPGLARPSFVVASTLAITAALALLGADGAITLYPIVVLAAVVLLDWTAGLITTGGIVVLLVLLRHSGVLGFLTADRIMEVGAASLLTVAAAWTLARNLVVAVDWSTRSQVEAIRNAEEARVNRAELAQAVRQLDYAYYRLQRANAALELAWKAADASERGKSEFVTNISHELRTPLNLIIGFSELILNSPETYRVPLPPPYRGDLNVVYRSAQHLLTLTNDVIDLARVGMGRLALVREPVDLGQVVEEACGLVREYVTAKSLWLRTEVAADLPPLSLDRLRIRQVLLNLLTNAARFTLHGGITITARRADGAVLVMVTDTGAGITPEDLPHVFEEFHHEGRSGADDDAPDNARGIGLGLPLSRRLVELQGGSMTVESTLGRGTTFRFTLPFVPAESVPSPVRPMQTRGMSGRGAERIVVLVGADDELTEFFERHLRGGRVANARDLPHAASLAVDMRALAILADDASTPESGEPLPVALIRLPLPNGQRRAAVLGADGFLVKPITRAKLRAALTGLRRAVRTVLVVDDDLRFARLLSRMLQSGPPAAGATAYTVLTAHGGQEALDLLATTTPDLVLLDIMMPDLSGLEVLAAMRRQPALADVMVIIISAADQLREQFPVQGSLSLAPPGGFGLEQLLDTLEALLAVLNPPHGSAASLPAPEA